jgi:hypothetical protein
MPWDDDRQADDPQADTRRPQDDKQEAPSDPAPAEATGRDAFLTEAEAEAEASARGGCHVEHVGVAYLVVAD